MLGFRETAVDKTNKGLPHILVGKTDQKNQMIVLFFVYYKGQGLWAEAENNRE